MTVSIGRCGIIMAKLTDPLSQLMDKLLNFSDEDINSVGFYCHKNVHGTDKCFIHLFNIYDNHPVKWMRLGVTLELFLGSPFVNKITYQQITDPSLESKFNINMINTISTNSKLLLDKNLIYTNLFFRRCSMKPIISDGYITGYTLVNKVLLNLSHITKIDLSKISNNIILCPIINPPITIVSSVSQDDITTTENKFIIDETRDNMTSLTAVFLDLFSSNIEFRYKILHMHDANPQSSSPPDNTLLDYFLNSLDTGILKKQQLQNILSEYGISKTYNFVSPIEIIDESILCTFSSHTEGPDEIDLTKLKSYIENVINSTDTVIDLNRLVDIYNEISPYKKIKNTNFQTISKSAILVGSQDPNSLKHNGILSMYGNNLKNIPTDKLVEVLKYIDQLKFTKNNDKYIQLQNNITYELALRQEK